LWSPSKRGSVHAQFSTIPDFAVALRARLEKIPVNSEMTSSARLWNGEATFILSSSTSERPLRRLDY
jgi:hypothetical protein